MYIYKITNIINNKIYIGQTINPIEKRWKRHIHDAMSNTLDTHFARAIRKYGSDNFKLELIDTANTQDELNKKEQYWIHFYNSIINGYNETDSVTKCGGNTYYTKTNEEMNSIKEKIRQSKLGSKNPMARPVKCKNLKTQEELHFGSAVEMKNYFHETNHNFVTRRCRHIISKAFRNEWLIAYEEDEYNMNYALSTNNGRGTKILVTNLETLQKEEFPFCSTASKKIGIAASTITDRLRNNPDKNFVIIKNIYKVQKI